MKKLVFIFAIMLGASFASCNSGSKAETDSVEVTTDSVEVVDSIVEVDSIAIDSVQ